MKITPVLSLFVVAASAASASGDFGTEAQSRELATTMSQIIRDGGVDAGIAAMHDTSMPFVATQMGVHVFEDSIIVADNREPELIASSYAEVADLTGDTMWPRIEAAADTTSEAVLEWYHYDTEAEYTYHCYSEWAVTQSVIVMVCR